MKKVIFGRTGLGVCDANCYLIYDENSRKACLIDAPKYDDEIMNVIESKELSLEYIILTHGHFDHILGGKCAQRKNRRENSRP